MPALHQNAVDFLSNAADAQGQLMTTAADAGGSGALTFTVTVEHDTFGATGQQVIGQWGLGGDIFIFGTIRNGEFSASADGYRWWVYNGSAIRVADYYVTLDGTRRTFVGRFDGSQSGDARINLWHGTSSDTALTDVTGSLSYIDPFGASGGFPATLPTSAGPAIDVGGDSYTGSYGIDGRVINAAVWYSALSDAQIEGTSMWDSTFREPADHSSLSPDSWWMMGDGTGDSGTTIADQGADGNDGTLTNGGNPSSDPSIVSISFLEALTAPLITTTTTFYGPTVAAAAGLNLQPPVNATTTTLSTPTVTTGAIDLSPGVNASTTSLFAHAVATGAVDLAPPVNSTSTGLLSHTVTAGAVDLTPPVNATSTSLFTHAVATVGVQLSVPFNASTTDLNAHTVTTGAVDLTPPLFASATSLFAHAVSSLYTLTAPFLGTSTSLLSPSVTAGAVDLQPSLESTTTSFFSHLVSAGGILLGAPLNASTTSFYAPTVASVGVSLQPGLQTSTTSFFSPTVTPGAVSLLAPLIGTTTGFNAHTVLLGIVVAPAIGGMSVAVNTVSGSSTANTISGAISG